jgi:hypothetical protein
VHIYYFIHFVLLPVLLISLWLSFHFIIFMMIIIVIFDDEFYFINLGEISSMFFTLLIHHISHTKLISHKRSISYSVARNGPAVLHTPEREPSRVKTRFKIFLTLCRAQGGERWPQGKGQCWWLFNQQYPPRKVSHSYIIYTTWGTLYCPELLFSKNSSLDKTPRNFENILFQMLLIVWCGCNKKVYERNDVILFDAWVQYWCHGVMTDVMAISAVVFYTFAVTKRWVRFDMISQNNHKRCQYKAGIVSAREHIPIDGKKHDP